MRSREPARPRGVAPHLCRELPQGLLPVPAPLGTAAPLPTRRCPAQLAGTALTPRRARTAG